MPKVQIYSCIIGLGLVSLLANCGGLGSPSGGGDGASVSSDAQDGSIRAPVGPPAYPTLLEKYTIRPDWRVAGVDYSVGPPAGFSFSNPATLAQNGVTVDSTAHRIRVSASGININGVDFSSDGGWTINIVAAQNVRISNSKFALTSAAGSLAAITSDAQSSGLYLGYNLIDGGGATITNQTTLLSFAAGATVEYNWVKNGGSDLIDISSGSSPSSFLIRYNLIERAGQRFNTSGNDIKIGAGAFTLLQLEYNTILQIPGGQLGTGGLNLQPPSGSGNSISSLAVDHNTMIAQGSPGTLSFLIATLPSQTTAGQVFDNFADSSGAIEFAYPGSSGQEIVYANNIDMNTGKSY